MPLHEWSKVIAASVVPVVIISACGLLCLAFYNRLANIVSRLRGFQRERLVEQQQYARCILSGQADRFSVTRHHQVLEMLETQTSRVMRRARLIRRTLLCLLGTIGALTGCSVATGLSVRWEAALYVAVPLFFGGAVLLLLGVTFAMLEMRDALEPVELESSFVSKLSHEFEGSLEVVPERESSGTRAHG